MATAGPFAFRIELWSSTIMLRGRADVVAPDAGQAEALLRTALCKHVSQASALKVTAFEDVVKPKGIGDLTVTLEIENLPEVVKSLRKEMAGLLREASKDYTDKNTVLALNEVAEAIEG